MRLQPSAQTAQHCSSSRELLYAHLFIFKHWKIHRTYLQCIFESASHLIRNTWHLMTMRRPCPQAKRVHYKISESIRRDTKTMTLYSLYHQIYLKLRLLTIDCRYITRFVFHFFLNKSYTLLTLTSFI